MGIQITDSVPDDVYEIRRVSREVWLDTYVNEEHGISKEEIEAVFKDDNTEEGQKRMERRKERYKDTNRHIWVAKDHQTIIGFCLAEKENGIGRIGAVYVLLNYQGMGIGSSLLKKALDWLGKMDIFVNVANYNAKAVRFYEKFGFVKTGKEGVFDEAARLPSGKAIPEVEMIRRVG